MRKGVLVLAVLAMGLGAGAARGATFTVTASGFAFSPQTITIAVGDSIKWVWGSGFHTTTSGTGSLDPQAGILWDASLDGFSTSFARRFTTAGVFPYFCRFHEDLGMTGTVIVNTSPQARDTVVMTLENNSVVAQLQGFDADGHPLTFAILSGPFHGSAVGLDPSTGIFTYNPATNYAGQDSIRFRVNDGFANSNTATMRITVTSNCNCPDQGDVINDDFAVDVFDVIQEIAIAFSGGSDVQDPGCPLTRGDVINNDAAVDVFDVIQEIAIAFSGGSPQDPCLPSRAARFPKSMIRSQWMLRTSR